MPDEADVKLQSYNIRKNGGFYRRYFKRPLDFMISFLALIVLCPFFFLISILIKLTSKGPIFYTQLRPGKDQKIFKLYKFRTMIQGADRYQKIGVEVYENDQRVTPLGKFLRRFKIDELPQLINVLKGEMSIVGPRPSLPEYLAQYEDWELERFKVRPGLTGLAQVNGNIYLDRKERSAYDVQYVRKVSFVLDLKIVLKTIAVAFYGEEKFINKLSEVDEHVSERDAHK